MSHMRLPSDERFVQPYLYITYDKEPQSTAMPINPNRKTLSTDQIVYAQMVKRGYIINQFEILLNLAAFDCQFSLNVTSQQINRLLSIVDPG